MEDFGNKVVVVLICVFLLAGTFALSAIGIAVCKEAFK